MIPGDRVHRVSCHNRMSSILDTDLQRHFMQSLKQALTHEERSLWDICDKPPPTGHGSDTFLLRPWTVEEFPDEQAEMRINNPLTV